MLISNSFDSGNIEVIEATDPSNIKLKIKADNQSDFYQWFHFRVSGVRDSVCSFTISNAGGAAYPEGWDGYKVCASYDRETWFRIKTDYNGESLTWSCDIDQDSIYFAYFAPYSMERHADLIADCANNPLVSSHVLGHTLDGQDMDLLEIGYGAKGRKVVWMIARQHPGETMAQWWMEGALERLLDEDDPVSRALLDKAHFYIIPNMNPDGSKRGHLRTNACGANLNREWQNPSMERSPEVFLTLKKMAETGVDFHMDVHGDEALPYNFLAGFEGNPGVNADKVALFEEYQKTLTALCPDFQMSNGYDIEAPGAANMTVGTNAVAAAFDCVAMTLEMPFKDNADLPCEDYGWSPERSRHLARGCLDALLQVIDKI